MRPRVLLFDVDGTLVWTRGAGRRAMERAFLARCGSPHHCRGFSFAGLTDRRIARIGLQAAGRSDEENAIDALLSQYLTYLAEEMAQLSSYEPLPGVRSVLQAAGSRSHCAVGLGTGNVREGARLKLAPLELDTAFHFGGFGCDHEDRAELLRIGAARGAQRLGVPLADCHVVVIGDTPLDIAAAQAIGAESIAVATGGYPVESLEQAGAHKVFRDLSAEGARELIVGCL